MSPADKRRIFFTLAVRLQAESDEPQSIDFQQLVKKVEDDYVLLGIRAFMVKYETYIHQEK